MSSGAKAPGVFVTGTDTGVGKTFLAASLIAGLRLRGEDVRVRKPLLSGLDEPAGEGPPHDHDLLASVAGNDTAATIAPLRFGPAVSPHLAAREAGVSIEPETLVSDLSATISEAGFTVVEGAGGLMVPISEGFLYRDLAVALGLPVVIAARPGLGTINHCLLTLSASRAAGLDPRLVVFGPWPAEPGPMELDNRDVVAGIGQVATATLPWIDHRDLDAFAQAGSALPLDLLLAAAVDS